MSNKTPFVRKNSSPLPSACGIIYASLGLAVRIMSGSPYEALHKIDLDGIMPPLWIFNLISIGIYFLAGFAAGNIIEYIFHIRPDPKTELFAYKGALFFICSLFLSLLWYPAFFVTQSLFVTVITLLLTVITQIGAAYKWSYVKKSASIFLIFSTLWHFYSLIVMIMIILSN